MPAPTLKAPTSKCHHQRSSRVRLRTAPKVHTAPASSAKETNSAASVDSVMAGSSMAGVPKATARAPRKAGCHQERTMFGP